jgi:tetratricopeptide (TPR) repeat protein
LLFLLGTYFPYVADREFHLAIASKKQAAAEDHLLKALSYNPYQPYYRFYFIRPLIDAKPNLSRERWMAVVATLDKSIALNPEEYEFHLYKARVLRNLLLQDPSNPKLYSSAVSAYQNALDCSPYNVFLRLEFASFLAHFGHYNQAASEAQKCLEQEPAFLNCRLFLVEMLLELNRGVEAKAQYARFQQDIVRYQKDLTDTTSSYVRELLTVNQKQKQKLEELIRPF